MEVKIKGLCSDFYWVDMYVCWYLHWSAFLYSI